MILGHEEMLMYFAAHDVCHALAGAKDRGLQLEPYLAEVLAKWEKAREVWLATDGGVEVRQ